MSGSKVSQDDVSGPERSDAAASKRKGLDPKRVADLNASIARSGANMSDWARRNGFSIKLVHEILSGRRSCVRGQSHRIAVMLGLKDGDLPDIDERLGGTPSLKNKP